LVPAGGRFVFALYRRTVLCPVWKLEKRWYANATPKAQARTLDFVVRVKRLAFAMAGRDFGAYVDGYKARRGMLFEQDIHDWLGGWPYESISPAAVQQAMACLGLVREREFTKGGYFLGVRWTEFGSACDEYVYARPQ
jgi:2-polyprenyl-6-hydroxyphenyl methylase/3-demethylubiquinone-9 3-methyltransferase